ncbi:hypothetical protein BTW08_00475 [Salinicola sp. MH3R3-1]|uniref:hypothetical protein n=1 Tax=Salinicola sp. MH3R3-1 TaxID=1928762 RepID=UPI00094E9A2E|nr:hypothetical protein [Salinicola sp. MH3R3-1]OLO09602.1 hypothetical protein BTW08_00475 [Salinicola sp. MH3R3-1]
MMTAADAELPVRIDRTHWVECLDGIALNVTLQRWVAQPRFRQRLTERLRRRHNLPAIDALPEADAADHALRQLDAAALTDCVRAAGVIVHANAVVREIQAPRVAALKQRLGADLYALALTHRSHGNADEAVGDDLDAFETRIERAGSRCLLVWAETRPPSLRAWLQLGWLGQLTASDSSEQPAVDDHIDIGSHEDTDKAREIARLAAAHLLSRNVMQDQATRQGGDPA